MTNKSKKLIFLDFFQIFRTLIILFEFDKTYPEARRILIDDRKKRSKKTKNLMAGMNMFGGMLNIIGLKGGDEKVKKKKKTISGDIGAEDLSQ